MGIGRSLLGGSVALGLASAATVAARRAASRRSALGFYERTGPVGPPLRHGSFYGGTPGIFHQSEGTWTVHGASLHAVAAVLPSDVVRPARLSRDRGVVLIGCMRHDAVTAPGVDGLAIPPYGEVLVGIAVTRQAAAPLLPLLAPARSQLAAGVFVLHLPVTNRVARDAGRGAWGAPKFVADIEFEDGIAECRTHLAEGGRTILKQQARPSGRASLVGESMTLYSVRDQELIELVVPMSLLERRRWGKAGGRLELGDHQVADELRALDIDPQPLLTRRMTSVRFALGLGQPVGTSRPYLGYIGEDQDFGRYIVRYRGGGAVDLSRTVLRPQVVGAETLDLVAVGPGDD